MPLPLIVFHCQDATAQPIGGADLKASSPNGPWEGLTNTCGDFLAHLTPGHYDIAISAPGFTTRQLPADLADCGVITVGLERRSAPPAPRTYRGNMCGVRVPGVEAVPGGAADASLVLSWFIDRYTPASRQAIYAAWKARGITDVLVSWPDSRSVGQSPQQFVATCAELGAAGFVVCTMLYSKDMDPTDVGGILANIAPVLPLLAPVSPRVCIGWELSIALSPQTVQDLIDALAPPLVAAGVKVYVHFAGGYFAWQPDGKTTADFWNANVGKLTGILHQRDLTGSSNTFGDYQARIVDCLQRFAGQFNFPSDSGFGHPFDFIALEVTAQTQFQGAMDEATGNQWGTAALTTPGVQGPLGMVTVMGSGNGQE